MTSLIALAAIATCTALVCMAVFTALGMLFGVIRAIDAADAETLSEARDEERAP